MATDRKEWFEGPGRVRWFWTVWKCRGGIRSSVTEWERDDYGSDTLNVFGAWRFTAPDTACGRVTQKAIDEVRDGTRAAIMWAVEKRRAELAIVVKPEPCHFHAFGVGRCTCEGGAA